MQDAHYEFVTLQRSGRKGDQASGPEHETHPCIRRGSTSEKTVTNESPLLEGEGKHIE